MSIRVSRICWLVLCSTAARGAEPTTGPWRAWVESPGGQLPFRLELERESNEWQAWIVNGAERIAVPRAGYVGELLVLDIDYYDSKIVARLDQTGRRFEGEWRKRGKGGTLTKMPFHATAGWTSRFLPPGHDADAATAAVAGRWSVKFEGSEDPAVGVFEVDADGVTGTFLTTTGDYRFLAGRFLGGRLQLSAFDGAHAFLFSAEAQEDGTLRGDFWSRDSWHETWTARRDAQAGLPDAFTLTRSKPDFNLNDLVFRDLDGKERSLGDAEFSGKARVIVIFGSWCPNCHDATNELVELHRKYRERGLAVVGLAFELTGDFGRDARQVRRYAERHGVDYPILLAGVADKEKASEALPILDRIHAFPTILFVDAGGGIQEVYTGFAGPAAGETHEKLRAQFESVIKRLLGE